MAEYKKKPVVIEAVQFGGFDNNGQVVLSERPEWLVNEFGKTVKFFQTPNALAIETLEGTMFASIGDYIIKGVQGELYPCKPDIFHATYERLLVWEDNI